MGKTGSKRVGLFSMRRLMKIGMGPCYFCGGKAGTVDHYIPTGKGGADAVTNVVPACGDCNTRKANMLPREFFEYCRELLIRRPLKHSRFMEKARTILRKLAPDRLPKPGELPSSVIYYW
jgi:hypothetical protein